MIVKFVRIFHPCLFAVHPRGGVRLFCFLRALPAKGNARQRGAHRFWQPLGLRHERDPREQAGRAQGDHRGRIAGGGHRLQHGAGRAGGLPLLGVVPEDSDVPYSLNRGIPLRDMNYYAARSYENIARRITGQRVPLMRI